jgi:Zn-dependent protease
MFSRNLHLVTIYGIPVEINITWIFVLILVTWTFATGFYPEGFPELLSTAQIWIISLLTAVLLFLSILLHEFSHSIVAARDGLPIKRITLFMFGGMAQMEREVDDPGVELRMASAGPLMTLLLVILYHLAARLTGPIPPVSILFETVGNINIGVLVFNLVPGFPLDGGRILRAAIWKKNGNLRRATKVASDIGQGFAWLLMLGGMINAMVYGNFLSGTWMVFIGLFLRQAAKGSYDQVAWRQALAGVKVSDLMISGLAWPDPSIGLAALVKDYFVRFHFDCIPIVDGGMFAGMVFLDDVTSVAKALWPVTSAGTLVRRGKSPRPLHPSDPAWNLFLPIIRQGHGQVPVTDHDGRLLGIVTRRDMSDLLKVMTSLDN